VLLSHDLGLDERGGQFLIAVNVQAAVLKPVAQPRVSLLKEAAVALNIAAQTLDVQPYADALIVQEDWHHLLLTLLGAHHTVVDCILPVELEQPRSAVRIAADIRRNNLAGGEGGVRAGLERVAFAVTLKTGVVKAQAVLPVPLGPFVNRV